MSQQTTLAQEAWQRGYAQAIADVKLSRTPAEDAAPELLEALRGAVALIQKIVMPFVQNNSQSANDVRLLMDQANAALTKSEAR